MCWDYIRARELPYNPLHDQGYASIGDTHSTLPGEGRAGRWAGTDKTECGIHTVAPDDVEECTHERLRRLVHRASPAAGKTTVANIVEAELEQRGLLVEHLDGDIVRTHLSKGLGFSKEDRDANIARIGWVASRIARAGAAVVVSAISPYEDARRHARSLVESHAPFIEVYVATPLEECARRDPKGLYAAAFAGEIDDFTGVSAPYEAPSNPEITLDTTGVEPGASRPHVVVERLEAALNAVHA